MKVIIGQWKERSIPSVGNGMSKDWHAEEVVCLGGSRCGWSVSALGGGMSEAKWEQLVATAREATRSLASFYELYSLSRKLLTALSEEAS